MVWSGSPSEEKREEHHELRKSHRFFLYLSFSHRIFLSGDNLMSCPHHHEGKVFLLKQDEPDKVGKSSIAYGCQGQQNASVEESGL